MEFDATLGAGLLVVCAVCIAAAVVVPMLPGEARAAKRQRASSASARPWNGCRRSAAATRSPRA